MTIHRETRYRGRFVRRILFEPKSKIEEKTSKPDIFFSFDKTPIDGIHHTLYRQTVENDHTVVVRDEEYFIGVGLFNGIREPAFYQPDQPSEQIIEGEAINSLPAVPKEGSRHVSYRLRFTP